MSTERDEGTIEPYEVELPPGHGELPETPTPTKGGENPHPPHPPIPSGPFTPITDPGEETSVEENDDDADRSKR
jgi:hypothetical protein